MILYNNENVFESLLIPDGSVILRSIQQAVVPMGLTFLLDATKYWVFPKWINVEDADEIEERRERFIGGATQFKYANGTFLYTFFIFAYLMVVRTTMAYNRYWSGCSSLMDALGKWTNAYMQTMSFIYASEAMKPDVDGEAKGQFKTFRMRVFRNWVLLGTCALGQIGGESEGSIEDNIACELDNLDYVFSDECKRRCLSDSVSDKLGKFVDDLEGIEDEEDIKPEKTINFRRIMREFTIRGLHMMDEERSQLIWAENKLDLIMMWITEDLSAAIAQKFILIPPPLWSRLFQDLSDGMLSYQNAFLVDNVKFPFAFSHFCNCLFLCFSLLGPFAISYFTGNQLLGTLSCLVISLGYFGLFNTALDIEEPFGQDSNDLPTSAMLREFAHLLEGMLESLENQLPRSSEFQKPKAVVEEKKPAALYKPVVRVNAVCEELGLSVFAPWLSPDELLMLPESVLREKFRDEDCVRVMQQVIWRECAEGHDMQSVLPTSVKQEEPVGDLQPAFDAYDDYDNDPRYSSFYEFEETDSWPSDDVYNLELRDLATDEI